MIYITGDTHGGQAGDMKALGTRRWKIGSQLSKEDYLIVMGDFGCVWSQKGSKGAKNDAHIQKWLHDKPWTTLFVDGNHENHDMLDELEEVEMFGDVVGKVNDSIYHLKRGRIYNIDGNRIFTMGGAKSYDREHRTLGSSYWTQEIPSYADMDLGLEALEKANWDVDYVFTHTCPRLIAGMVKLHKNLPHNANFSDPTEEYLEHIRKNVKCKLWYFGHWHGSWQWENFVLVYNRVLKLGEGINDL